MDKTKVQEEVQRNYAAFLQQLPDLLPTRLGKFALMKDGKIVEFFETVGDAYSAGQQLYSDGIFSVQEVTEEAVDLGFFSHALLLR